MARKLSPDKILFAVTVALVLVGVVMVFSASAVVAKEKFNDPYYFLYRQFGWALIGLIAMSVMMHIDYRKYRHPVFIYGLLFISGMFLTALFFLDQFHNTNRWIRWGPLSFQPSELSKLALIIFLASLLEKRLNRINDWRHTLLPCIIILGVFLALIVFEPDLGTAVSIVIVAFMLLICAGLRIKYLLYGCLTATVLGFPLIYFYQYRVQRILTFLNPWDDPQGAGFQIIQSLIAVGSGGLTGLGLMEGIQKRFYLPEPHTDFIFAVIGEEWGLVGTLIVLGLFGVFLFRGVRLSLKAPDSFGWFLGIGLTMMIVCQAFINMSVTLSLLPTKGIPLPFISSGGSSLLVSLLSVGILLNISQHSN